MAVTRREVNVCHCEKCGCDWIPRNALTSNELPRRCGNPKCNTPWWNERDTMRKKVASQ